MGATTYTYSVADDTLNGKCDPYMLHTEIDDNVAITVSVKEVETVGDVLDVTMNDALSAPEETELDNTVGAHAGVPSEPGNYSELSVDRTTSSNSYLTLLSIDFDKSQDHTQLEITFMAAISAEHGDKSMEFELQIDSVAKHPGTDATTFKRDTGSQNTVLRRRISGISAGSRTIDILWRVRPGDSTTLQCCPVTYDFEHASLKVEEV